MQTEAAAQRLVNALQAHLQARTGQAVELHETHISWVLLAGRLAYKLKKPVRLPFLDFSTPALRKHFCEEEVRLNRRLAGPLYLGVEPVCGTAQAPRIGGAGPVIDHVVCMQRFPAGALLSERLAAGRLQPPDLDQLAQRLADFHQAAEPAPQGRAVPVAQPVRDVLDQLGDGDPAQLAGLRAWVQQQARHLQPTWEARRRAGAVRECHGDLHLANAVKLDREVMAFDCIEFDPALRWTDVMSDVAFLSMDLLAHGRGDLAFRFLDAYLQRSGDYAGVPVLRFQQVYRALVRALVGHLRAASGGPNYLACAQSLAQPAAGGARLLITHGLSGSGKSSLAGQLLEAAGAVRVRSDVERKRLFGLTALQPSGARAPQVYSAEATQRTNERLRECAGQALQAGYPVIVDATFLRRAERRTFQDWAAALRVPFAILHCRAGEAVLRRRVAARGAGGSDASEATVAVLEQQLAQQEPLADDERGCVLEAATDAPVDVGTLWARWRAMAA
ncbi:MAG TPA: AAA family ATPase [Burkholderiaceae bacterium]|nr:AAA family ATPase [Burkholderiaceae bacterium]